MGEAVATEYLGPGGYVYVWSDARGCVALVAASIGEPAPLTVQLSGATEILESGTLICVVNGGTAPYSYYLNGEYSQTGSWSNLDSGVYEVLVSDSLQCEASAAVIVETPSLSEGLKNSLAHIHPIPVRSGRLLEVVTMEVFQEFLLFNTQGALIHRQTPETNRITIDLSEISAGMYSLIGIGNQQSFSRLIVVQD
jgi:hypothetical protein